MRWCKTEYRVALDTRTKPDSMRQISCSINGVLSELSVASWLSCHSERKSRMFAENIHGFQLLYYNVQLSLS